MVSSRPESRVAAEARLQDALHRDPMNVIRYNDLANHLLAGGQTGQAIALYRTAISIAADHAALHFNLANALAEAGADAAALEAHGAALRCDPGFAAAYTNSGNLLRRLGRAQDALEAYRRALYLAPLEGSARYNLGTALLDLGRPAEALPFFEQAAMLRPPYPPALASAGEALLRLGRRDAAQGWFAAALKHDPADHAARMGLAVGLLAAGDFAAGWAAFEARLESAQVRQSLPSLEGVRLAPGDAVAGKHVVVMAEQGFGDTLHFVRYVRLLRERGARVTLLVPPDLVGVLSGVADAVHPKEWQVRDVDFICPMLSLPFVFGTTLATIPADLPYLAASAHAAAYWQRALPPGDRLRVGLVWSGNPAHLLDAQRSLKLADLAAVLAVPGVAFHAVQTEFRAGDLPVPAGVQRHDDALADFAATAGLLARMDLVIAVDTAVAHLAGGMGRRLWLLLGAQADFRWLEGRDDSPWYPGAKLFRQGEGGWAPVIAAVAQALAAVARADADFRRGNALWSQGRHDKAIRAFRAAAARDPLHLDARNHLGNALLAQGRTDAAIAAYRDGIAIAPGRADLRYNLANALLSAGRAAEAEAEYRTALARAPDHVGANNNLGNALRNQGRHDEALGPYQAALRARPDFAGTLNNVASTLLALHRPDEAMPLLQRAIALQPDYAEACNNLGGALLALDRPGEAITWFQAAAAADPDLAQARFGAALALLAEGDYTAGWRAYASRWEDPRFCDDAPDYGTPIWTGAGDIAGQRMLLHAEQGLGDTIQFARYAPILRAAGAIVVLQVQAPLLDLLAPLADEIVAAGDPIPAHDLRCPLLSLPHALGTTLATVPAQNPYLHAEPARIVAWRARLGAHPVRPRVGIVFSGSPDNPDDALRSISAADLIAALPGAELHVVQRDVRAADMAVLAANPEVRRHRPGGFAEIAALLECLDLVVSVDTAIAHLAGALGRPVWVLLQFAADFRWLRGRADSPWYPTARLFRQATRGDWGAALAGVTTSLHRR